MPSTPENKRLQRLHKEYGIDQTWIDAALKLQDNCCAGCKRSFDTLPRYVVDHKHDTSVKIVRCLLCDECNGALGTLEKLRKDMDRFERLTCIADMYVHYETIYPSHNEQRTGHPLESSTSIYLV